MKNLFLFYIFIFFLQCNQSDDVFFLPSDIYNFDGIRSNRKACTLWTDPNKSTHIINLYTDSVTIQSLDNKAYRKITFPPGLARKVVPDWFFIFNLDSIYVLNMDQSDYFLIRSAKEFQYKKRPVLYPNGSKFEARCNQIQRPIVQNRNVTFSIAPYKTLDSFFQYPIQAIWNIQTDSVSFYGEYLPMYNSTNWWFIQGNQVTSVAVGDDQTMLSFPVSDTLIQYNTQNSTITRRVVASSRYLGDFPPHPITKEEDNSSILANNYGFTLKRYLHFLHDPYRKVYYRIVSHGVDKQKAVEEKLGLRELPWSIMILNESFEVIGEHKIKPGKYNNYDVHVVPAGLLIRNDYARDKQKRNLMEYTLFKPLF